MTQQRDSRSEIPSWRLPERSWLTERLRIVRAQVKTEGGSPVADHDSPTPNQTPFTLAEQADEPTSAELRQAGRESANRVAKQIVRFLGSALLCIVLITGTIMMRSCEPAKDARGQKNTENKERIKGSLLPMNVALGNVVVIIPELGLAVKNSKEINVPAVRLAAQIDRELVGLREFYRSEAEKHPVLMGAILLELTVGPSGEVTRVKEIATRISDGEFRKAVIAAADKWEFKDVVPAGATIVCPLLFVREGMDITTLVKWERAGLFDPESRLVGSTHSPEAVKPTPPAKSSPLHKASRTIGVNRLVDCTAISRKGQLETLSVEEIEFLRKGCK